MDIPATFNNNARFKFLNILLRTGLVIIVLFTFEQSPAKYDQVMAAIRDCFYTLNTLDHGWEFFISHEGTETQRYTKDYFVLLRGKTPLLPTEHVT